MMMFIFFQLPAAKFQGCMGHTHHSLGIQTPHRYVSQDDDVKGVYFITSDETKGI